MIDIFTLSIFILASLAVGFIAGGVFMAIATYHHEQEIEHALRVERGRKVSISLDVWITENERAAPWMRRLPGDRVDPHKAINALSMIYTGRSFSERELRGILSRSEYQELRDWLLVQGFAEWRNPDAPRQGIEFTTPGQALLRTAYEHRTSPLQHEGDREPGGRGARMRTHARLRTA